MTTVHNSHPPVRAAAVLLLGLLIAITGCAITSPRQRDSADSAAPAAESPKSSESKSVSVQLEQPDVVLTDPAGKMVARVRAASAGVSAQTDKNGLSAGKASNALGVLRDARATLYQDGAPVATVQADQVQVDAQKRTLTAHGHVIARSLSKNDPPEIRADTVRWEQQKNQIRGQGNVVLTRGDNVRIPADSFVADSVLKTVTLTANQNTATRTENL